MEIRKRKDGLNVVIFDTNFVKEIIQHFKSNPYDHLWIQRPTNEGDVFKLIKDINLKHLLLFDINEYGYEGLYNFKELEGLNFHNNINLNIDLTKFKNLKKLLIVWSKKLIGLSECKNIEDLYLINYKGKGKNFIEFENLKNLQEFIIVKSDFEHFNGLEALPNLKILDIAYNSKLTLTGNENIVLSQVEELIITSCKKTDLSLLSNIFPNLKTLEIRNMGKIPSIKPILDGLSKLERLFVSDGTIIEETENEYYANYQNIKEFAFQDKKENKLKCKDLGKRWINISKSVMV